MNENTIQIIKATVPVIKSKGQEIVNTMYPLLFERYPETVELFKNAPEDQKTKLANAVYAYASNIDKLANLGKGIEGMATTHVKTNIQPEHYPLVGECLLDAIKIVLKEDATDEIIQAWGEAYGFLSNVLINKEKEMYAQV